MARRKTKDQIETKDRERESIALIYYGINS
jgi:hypothetical protein